MPSTQRSKTKQSPKDRKAAAYREYVDRRVAKDPFWLLWRGVNQDPLGTISVDDIRALYERQRGLCAYTGRYMPLPALIGRSRAPHAPSVERLDNSLPHTPDNCVLVMRCLNLTRGAMDLGRFLKSLEGSGLVVPGHRCESLPTLGRGNRQRKLATVEAIKADLASGLYTQTEIAIRYGYTQSAISKESCKNNLSRQGA